MAAEGEGISLAHLFVDAGDFRRFVAWTDDGAAGLGFEGGIAAGMVAVMMGGEDVRELPALQFSTRPRPLWRPARRLRPSGWRRGHGSARHSCRKGKENWWVSSVAISGALALLLAFFGD